MTWRGAWSALLSYRANDAVSYNGSSWIALTASSGASPLQGGGFWAMLAQAGASGSPGLSWKGPWVSTTQYNPNDVVSFGGSSWVAQFANATIQPGTAASVWSLMAGSGAPGPPGISGIEYDSSTTGSINPGASLTGVSVQCSGSKKVISGGYSASLAGIHVFQNSPNATGNGWTFQIVNTGAAAGTVTLYAVCATAG